MQQERNVVVLDYEIALKDFRRERQAVEILRLHAGPRRIQMNTAIVAIACTCNLIERFAFRKFNNGIIEFAGNNKVDLRIVHETIRFDLTMPTDGCGFQIGSGSPPRSSQREVT